MNRGFAISRIVVFVLVFTIATISLCFAQFAGGTGTVASPYQVATAAQLNIVRSYPAAHFVQTANIDLGIAPYNTGAGWAPIAMQTAPFTGTYQGNGFKILNLFINRPVTNYQGLFAYTSNAEIQQVVLENARVTGKDYTAALLGCGWNTVIQKSSATGTIAGAALVGGLIGSLEGGSTITESYANCTTSGQTSIGGLIGNSKGSSHANACYSAGQVNGTNAVGGLVGTQGLSITSYCYSATNVTGSWAVGGLLGLNDTASQINYSFAYGLVSGTSSVGGLVGRSVQSQTTDSYWNTQTSTQTSSAGGIGSSTDDMNYPYAASTFVGWDFSGLWREDLASTVNAGYPYLSWQYTPPVVVDLAISGFICPAYSAVGMQTNIRVQVISNSTNAQSGYQVKLYQEGGIELLSQNGNPINNGETLEYVFAWTPTAIGSVNLYAVVVLTGDQDSANDQSVIQRLQVFAAGTISLTVGTGNETARLPLDMYYRNSLFEVVIPASELGFMGHINQLDFYNNFVTNLPNMPTRIWLGETALSDLSAGWIPSPQLSQVFDGNVDYPSGINTINIPLQVPYNYQGGNLVMLVQRPMDSVYYSYVDMFYCQTVGTNRSRRLWSDSITYDPANPSNEGTLSGQYPKTTFHLFGDYIVSPPQNLAADYSLGDDWLNLAWDMPLNGSPVSYNVYRNGVFLQNVTETGFEDTSLAHGSSYSYYVTAAYGYEESAATEAVSVTVYKRPQPALCVNPADGAVQVSFQPEFVWTPDSLEGFPQPDGYEFLLWTVDEPTVLSTVFLADQTNFAILDVLLPETQYFWKLTPYISTPDRNGDNNLGLNSLAETRERSVLYAQNCPAWSFTTKAAIALTLTPPSWDFGDVLISTSVFQDFSCINIGAYDAIINSVYLTGDSLSAFSLDTATPPISIEPMGSLSVRVYFNPLYAGTQNVSLVLVDSDGDLHSIPISGIGFAEAVGRPVNLTAELSGWKNVALNWEMDYTERYQMESGKSDLALNSAAETNQRSLQYFNIYRNAELIATSTEPFFYDADMQDGWYEYYVTAVFQTFMSEPSNTASVEIFTILPPQNLSATYNPGEDWLSLNWNEPLIGSPVNYNIYRNGVLHQTVTDTSFED
ncbi:MAG: hypothetical protein RBS43_08325, partial [Candidatus Cloacimonas sp.]|nr:hypothetical protein [Candidatus Cloacimonas sp.]